MVYDESRNKIKLTAKNCGGDSSGKLVVGVPPSLCAVAATAMLRGTPARADTWTVRAQI